MRVKAMVEFEVLPLEGMEVTARTAVAAAELARVNNLALTEGARAHVTDVVYVHVEGFGKCSVELMEEA